MKQTLKKRKLKRAGILSAILAGCLSLSACTTVPASQGIISKEARVSASTKTQIALQNLPAPSSKVTVAVYGFQDKTGQFKPTEAGQTLSRAVTQGGEEVLIKALHDAGYRSWFTVIERSNLNNLLKERQIISEMRSRYLGESKVNPQSLPPLLFAGVLFEGGIVGYDTNTVTGGMAARYLGIGGRTDYRQNVVTVHLRAVSVKTGEVLASVTTEKTIASVGVSANAFRFVTFDNLLEADAGITSNEPGLLALRQAVEKSVYALIMEGSEIGLWDFRDKNSGMALLEEYRAERDGRRTPRKEKVSLASSDLMDQISKPSRATKPKKMARVKAPKSTVVTKAKVVPQAKPRPAPKRVASAKPQVKAKPHPAPKKTVRLATKPVVQAAPVEKATPMAAARVKTAPTIQPTKPTTSQPIAPKTANVAVEWVKPVQTVQHSPVMAARPIAQANYTPPTRRTAVQTRRNEVLIQALEIAPVGVKTQVQLQTQEGQRAGILPLG